MPDQYVINWQIDSIRTTIFFKNSLNPNNLEGWLSKVSEYPPLQINKMPLAFNSVSKSSPGFLRVNMADNRLDILLSPEELRSNQTIAPFSEISSLFSQFVDNIPDIAEMPLVDRLAVGVVLSLQVTSNEEGVEIISPHISGVDLPITARDFLYRINLPSKSQVIDDLSINRLAVWSIGYAQLVHVQINSNGSQSQEVFTENNPTIHLELDINTDGGTQIGANTDQLRVLLSELKSIALSVANNGESVLRN